MRPRLVCRCGGVSSLKIAAAAREATLESVDEVSARTAAGSGCRSCHPEIEELLCELAGRPFDLARARENERACADATLQRVERALWNSVTPRLPAGCEVDLIHAEGLQVSLHVHGGGPEIHSLVRRELEKAICDDLEVSFD